MTSRRAHALHILVSASITAVMLYAVFAEEQSGDFWGIIGQISGTGVAIYMVLSIAVTVLRAIRYRLLLRATVGEENTPGLFRLLLIATVRDALVDFLPARLGETTYIYFLNRSGIRVSTGALTFAFCILLDVLVLLFIVGSLCAIQALTSVVGSASIFSGPYSAFFAVALVVGLGALLFAVVKTLPRLLEAGGKILRMLGRRAHGSHPRVEQAADTLAENVDLMAAESAKLQTRGVLRSAAHITFWLRLCKYGALYVLLLAVVGQWGLGMKDIPLLSSLGAFVTAEASASLPVSGLMGFGAYEGSWSWTLRAFGVDIPSTVKVAFIIHLIAQVRAYSLAALAMGCLLFTEVQRDDAPDKVGGQQVL